MKKGFTAIEVIIVLAIFLIIAGISLPLAGGFSGSAGFEQLNAELLGWLRQSRSKAEAGYNSSSFGVKLFADHYVVFEGSDYNQRNQASDIMIEIPQAYSLAWDLEANSSQAVFVAGSGQPLSTGTIEIIDTSGAKKIININSSGLISANE